MISRPLNIGIDVASASRMYRHRGIGVYTVNLLRGLAEVDRETRYSLFVYEPAPVLASELPPNFDWVSLRPHSWGRASAIPSHQLALPLLARTRRLDLLHFPYVPSHPSHPGPTLWGGVPSVVTLHDLTPLVFPEQLLPNARRRLYYRAMLRACGRARRVIADSAQTAADARRFGVVPDGTPIEVVPLAAPSVDIVPQPSAPCVADLLARPFLLHVGGAAFNKNQRGVLDAYAILRERDGVAAPLVLVGGHHLPPGAAEARSPGLDTGIVRFTDLPPSDLRALYRHATALVFPSLYEGFGLPILEAMKQGCPVVTSESGATAEVAGDAALLVDPHDPSAIATAARRLIEDDGLHRTLRDRGIARASQFSWRRTATATLRVYREAAGAPHQRYPPSEPA